MEMTTERPRARDYTTCQTCIDLDEREEHADRDRNISEFVNRDIERTLTEGRERLAQHAHRKNQILGHLAEASRLAYGLPATDESLAIYDTLNNLYSEIRGSL